MTSLADFFPLRVLYPSPSRPKLNSLEFEGIKNRAQKNRHLSGAVLPPVKGVITLHLFRGLSSIAQGGTRRQKPPRWAVGLVIMVLFAGFLGCTCAKLRTVFWLALLSTSMPPG